MMRENSGGIRSRLMHIAFVILYILIILFITIFIREPSLRRSVNTAVFNSYGKAIAGNTQMIRQVLLNVALFIPYGYLVMDAVYNVRYNAFVSICVIIMTSLMVEIIQYFAYRGQFDVDDLISNAAGGTIGIAILELLGRAYFKKGHLFISISLILIGVFGCIYSVNSRTEEDYTKYFDFRISSVRYEEGMLEFQGQCYVYGRDTPDYSITIAREGYPESSNKANIEISNGQKFKAKARANPNCKYEIIIRFNGFKQMSTGVWLRIDDEVKIEYVSGIVEITTEVPERAVLKAYSEEYDTYVFENEGRIVWLIGWPNLDSDTEIIYHIDTDEPFKLPQKRIQYGFDNRGFRAMKDKKHATELESIMHYRVFEKEIPHEYHATTVTVGFNTNGTVTWRSIFRTGTEF